MNYSKESVKCAILTLSKIVDKEKNYEALLNSEAGLERIIQILVYDLFISEFLYYFASEENYAAYQIIHEFSFELREKGYVKYRQ